MIQLDNIYICLLLLYFCIELFFSSVIIAMALAFILIHIISIIIRKKNYLSINDEDTNITESMALIN